MNNNNLTRTSLSTLVDEPLEMTPQGGPPQDHELSLPEGSRAESSANQRPEGLLSTLRSKWKEYKFPESGSEFVKRYWGTMLTTAGVVASSLTINEYAQRNRELQSQVMQLKLHCAPDSVPDGTTRMLTSANQKHTDAGGVLGLPDGIPTAQMRGESDGEAGSQAGSSYKAVGSDPDMEVSEAEFAAKYERWFVEGLGLMWQMEESGDMTSGQPRFQRTRDVLQSLGFSAEAAEEAVQTCSRNLRGKISG
jgi:hypothetical protein